VSGSIYGSKFRAVASIDSTRERLALQRYLDSIEEAEDEQQASIDSSAVQAALEKLKQHPEPEAGFMLMRQTSLPAYNVQTAVDAEHALIVAHAMVLDASDIRCLKPMAEAAKKALEVDNFQVVADAGYSNGEQAAHCEAAGMTPYVPVMRTVNNQGETRRRRRHQSRTPLTGRSFPRAARLADPILLVQPFRGSTCGFAKRFSQRSLVCSFPSHSQNSSPLLATSAGKGHARFCWNYLAKKTPARFWLAPLAGLYFSASEWETLLER
jgi:hypothetical protein